MEVAGLDSALNVVWEPQAGPQTHLLTCPVFEVFFGGARGGGKTDGMLGDWASHADLYGEHAIGLMVRRQRTELVETIERSRQLYSAIGWEFKEQEKMWRAPNGARLRFAYLERDQDAESYQGHSYSRVYVEEVGNFPSPKPILKLLATLRSGAGVPCGMRLTGNPGGPGHQWVKARYIDPAPSGYEIVTDPASGLQRVFIPSKIRDNRFLGEDYVQRLRAVGSENLVRAWLDGDWSVIDGAFFDGWSNERHIIKPFAIPKGWLRFRSMDWGFAAPFSVGWWAVCPDVTEGFPRGALIRYREWYGASSPNVGLRLTAEEVADGIASRERGDDIKYGVLDPAAFSQDGGPSIAERMERRKVYFRRADNQRVGPRGAMGGWDQMRARLKGDADGRPMLYVFDTCRDFIRTVPALQHDPDRPEDLDTDGEDHCFAAGTLVETDRGQVAIEKLPDTGRVLTKTGEYVPYRSARMTRKNAPLVKVTFDDGMWIKCTPDHRFMVDLDEWCYASELANRSVICRHPSYLKRCKSLLASAFTNAAHTFKGVAFGCIERFGKRQTGQFQPVITSTTWTATDQITHSIIWNVSLPLSTLAIDTGKNSASGSLLLCQRHKLRQQHGTEAPKGGNGILSITKSIFARCLNAASRLFAKCAGTNTKRSTRSETIANSAIRTARRVHCAAVEPLQERADVYCLTVPSTGCFALAGGLIVSNCADEARYGCMSRPWIPQQAIEQRPSELQYVADPDGSLRVNMSVFEIVEAKRRKRLAQG